MTWLYPVLGRWIGSGAAAWVLTVESVADAVAVAVLPFVVWRYRRSVRAAGR